MAVKTKKTSKFVAYIVHSDGTYTLIDMGGRVLKDPEDVMRWLAWEAPKRPDLRGRRIDVVDADEELPRAH